MPADRLSQNSIFLIYVAILAALLIAAGGVLAILTLVLHRNVRSVWATYRGWLVLIPVTFGAIYYGRRPTVVLFTIFALLAFREFARAARLNRDRLIRGTGYFLVIATGGAAALQNPFGGSRGGYGPYMALPVFAVALLAFIPILRNRTQGQLQIVSQALFGYMCIGWLFLHVALLVDIGNVGFLLYLLLAVELNDVAAFTFGKLLGRGGKHRLRSHISPGKTWEGALGALTVSMILPWLLRFSLPGFGPAQLVLTGLIVGIGGQIGDLCISVIKRDLGVKDMGSLITGHGGMLDRIDSLIFSGPLFFHMIRAFDGHV